MEIHMTFKGRAFSINKAFYKRSFTRTRECRDWFESIFSQAIHNGYCELMESFSKEWGVSPSGISVTIVRHIPHKDFWTVKGEVSILTMDVTNVEKLMVDALFDNHYHGYTVDRSTYTNLDIDDKWVTELHSFKLASDDVHASIEIIIRPTPLENRSPQKLKTAPQKGRQKRATK